MKLKVTSFQDHIQKLAETFSGQIHSNHNKITTDDGEIHFAEIEQGIYGFIFNIQSIEFPQKEIIQVDFSNYQEVDFLFYYSISDVALGNRQKDQSVNLSSKRNFTLADKNQVLEFDHSQFNDSKHILILFSIEKLKEKKLSVIKDFLLQNKLAFFESFEDIGLISSCLHWTINRKVKFKDEISKALITGLFYSTLEYINSRINVYSEDQFLDNSTSNKVVLQVKQDVIENIGEKPNIEFLAIKYGVTREELEASFKRIYGISIFSFYNKFRLIVSRKLLLERRMSVKEITYELGYTDLPFFSKQFKKQYGLSPTAFLQRYGA